MRTFPRAIAAALMLALSLSACGGHSSSLPALSNNPSNTGSNDQQPALRPESQKPFISIPRTFGKLAYSDAGRRAANAQMQIALVLKYNHEAELEQFIATQSGPNG